MAERYNYMEAMKEDIKEYINNEVNLKDFADREDLEEKLNEDLWVEDSVTGNASGSYYCNSWKAEEAFDSYWDDEEAWSMTLSEWVGMKMFDNGIKCDVYFKNEDGSD